MGGSCNVGTGAWHRSRHERPFSWNGGVGMAMDDSPNIPGSLVLSSHGARVKRQKPGQAPSRFVAQVAGH